MNKLEEQFYALAASEIAERRPIHGIMAKAYSDANGEEKVAAAIYIRLRVQQLIAEHQKQNRDEKLEIERQLKNVPDTNDEIDLLCPACGHSKAKRVPRGEWGLFLALLLLFIVPGLIYALVNSGYRFKCSDCGKVTHEDRVKLA